jgi:ubiquinone/menaquinone biosynthesis C-methylase UbiE
MTALKEIARVLQPTGVFGVIWNIEDCKSAVAIHFVSVGLNHVR